MASSFQIENSVHRVRKQRSAKAYQPLLTYNHPFREVVNHNGGLFGLAVTVFKKIRKYVDEDLNWKLAEVQTKSTLADAISANASSVTLILDPVPPEELSLEKFFGPTFSLDFVGRILSAATTRLELSSVGGIKQLIEVLTNSGSSNFTSTNRLPGVSTFLKTDCGDSMCIADVIPQLSDKYPKANIERNSINIGGRISLRGAGHTKRQEAVADLEIVADTLLSVKITNAELADIALLGGQLIENMVNRDAEHSKTLYFPVLHLDNIRINVLSRKLLIRTDFGIDERRLSRIAEKHKNTIILVQNTFRTLSPVSRSVCGSVSAFTGGG
ncbi:unnamed protein product, partial [Mesorhabditis spiculigera]